MTNPTLLTQSEIAAVSGGGLEQSINISTLQTSTSTVTQTATATSSGTVAATATSTLSAVVAAGPMVSSPSVVLKANLMLLPNGFVVVVV